MNWGNRLGTNLDMQSQSLPSATDTLPSPGQFARFVSAPASARPLAALRIGVAGVLLLQAFALVGSLLPLYGERGMVPWSVGTMLVRPEVPHLSWLAAWLSPWGISAASVVQGAFLVYVASLSALLIGWQTRLAAVLACLTHLLLINTGHASMYGVDMFAQIALFYCVVMPVGHAFSVDTWASGRTDRPSPLARLSLRVLQIHLCVVYLTSGIDKAEGVQWWNGEAIWRGLMRPDLNQFDVTWLAAVPVLAMLACWGSLIIELGYAVFVWPRRTRVLWAMLTIGLHAGIALLLGLWSFSALMMVLTGSAFLISAEPRQEKRPRTFPRHLLRQMENLTEEKTENLTV